MILTKEQYVEWASHPTTKVVKYVVMQYVQEARNEFVRKFHNMDQKEALKFAGYLNGLETAFDLDQLLDFDGDTKDA